MAEFNYLKVREEIKRQLADIFEFESRDPRLEFITVMDVKLTKDARYATVYVSPMETEIESDELLKLLKEDSGYFRSQLAQRVRIKHTPELRFEIDVIADKTQRIDEILRAEGQLSDEPEASETESSQNEI